MAYLLDGLVLLLFGGMIYLGYRQGLVRTLSGVLSFVLALALTGLLTTPVTEIVYDRFVQPTVVERLEIHIGEDSPGAEKVDAALEKMPAYVRNRLRLSDIHSGADLLARIGDAEEGVSSVEWIAEEGIRPFVYPALEAVCSVALFLALSLVLGLLFRLLEKVADIPGIRKVNKIFGLLAGAIQGVMWAFFLVNLLELITLGEMLPLFSEELLDSTLLVSRMRQVNPFVETIREFLTIL